MIRDFLAGTLLCVSTAAIACPLCMGAFQQSKAQELVTAPHVVLAVPTGDPSRFRVIDVVKGERPASGTVEGGYPRNGPVHEATASTSGEALLLVRDELFPTWTIFGAIGTDHVGWLRKLATGNRVEDISAEEWRARVALVVPYLENRQPLVAEIALGELASAPYGALLTVRSRLAVPAIRRWLADPALAQRESLYLLLLGIAGDARDVVALERRLEAAHAAGEATSLGSALAADLQLRGPARLAWVEEHYLVDRRRSPAEIEAALTALSVHGNANAAIPRERVIAAYRSFMRAHPDIAGYVARDLAAWQYWDAVPEYVALLQSDVRQQYPSRIAIVAYLRQSPNASAIALPPSTASDARATNAFPVAPR